MPVGLLWGWDATNNVWIPLQVDVNGFVKVDMSAINLDDLGDVNVPAPSDHSFLYWDAAAGEWKSKLPHTEYGLYRSDYGLNWADLGVIASSAIRAMAYLGNGIAILGDNAGHVYRSTDHGATWTDLGVIATDDIRAMAYLGNGIAILGDRDFHVYRSTDYGATWTDLGVIATADIRTMAYLGNGIAILGDAAFHVYRSIDYGATWADLGVIATDDVGAIAYLGNGIAIFGDYDRHVYRSTDYGATWTDLGVIFTGDIFSMAYLGNGIAILGDGAAHVYRSTDYGATWTDLGVITIGSILSMAYLSNGIAILGDNTFHVYRSIDYGATWTDLGVITTSYIGVMAYLGNGIAILGDGAAHVHRSVSAFQLWTSAAPGNLNDTWDVNAPAPGGNNALIWDAATSSWIPFRQDRSCRAYHDAAQNLLDMVWTTLAFNSERWDTDNIHDNTVNNSRLTCRTAGKYLIAASIEFDPNAVGTRGVSLRLNGALAIGGCQWQPPSTVGAHSEISPAVIWDLAVGDYVEVRAVQGSGGALNVPSTAYHTPEFMMALLGR